MDNTFSVQFKHKNIPVGDLFFFSFFKWFSSSYLDLNSIQPMNGYAHRLCCCIRFGYLSGSSRRFLARRL